MLSLTQWEEECRYKSRLAQRFHPWNIKIRISRTSLIKKYCIYRTSLEGIKLPSTVFSESYSFQQEGINMFIFCRTIGSQDFLIQYDRAYSFHEMEILEKYNVSKETKYKIIVVPQCFLINAWISERADISIAVSGKDIKINFRIFPSSSSTAFIWNFLRETNDLIYVLIFSSFSGINQHM